MIVHDKQRHTFTLHTAATTYQMKVDGYGVLLHTYYGGRIAEADLSYLIRFADRGFSPNPAEAGHCRTYSLDTLPQEYSTCGAGDFRLPSLELAPADGSRVTDLRYTGYEIRAGKYALEGLPAFHGEGGETLVIFLEDAAAQVEEPSQRFLRLRLTRAALISSSVSRTVEPSSTSFHSPSV